MLGVHFSPDYNCSFSTILFNCNSPDHPASVPQQRRSACFCVLLFRIVSFQPSSPTAGCRASTLHAANLGRRLASLCDIDGSVPVVSNACTHSCSDTTHSAWCYRTRTVCEFHVDNRKGAPKVTPHASILQCITPCCTKATVTTNDGCK